MPLAADVSSRGRCEFAFNFEKTKALLHEPVMKGALESCAETQLSKGVDSVNGAQLVVY